MKARFYAFYLYLDNDVLLRTPYSAESTYKFPLEKPRTYRVKWCAKSPSGEISSGLSERFRFEGFRDVPFRKPQSDYAIAGVTKTSGFAAHVFDVRNNVRYFADPTGERGVNFLRPTSSGCL